MIDANELKRYVQAIDESVRNLLTMAINLKHDGSNLDVYQFLTDNLPTAEHFELEGNKVEISFLRGFYNDLKNDTCEGVPAASLKKPNKARVKTKRGKAPGNVRTRGMRKPKSDKSFDIASGAALKAARARLKFSQEQASIYITKQLNADNGVGVKDTIIVQSNISLLERGFESKGLTPKQALDLLSQHSLLDSTPTRQSIRFGGQAKALREHLGLSSDKVVAQINEALPEGADVMTVQQLDLLEAGHMVGSVDQHGLIAWLRQHEPKPADK